MAYNRELSQFASLVEVNDTSRKLGISTDLTVSGVVTATRFYGSGRFLTDIVTTNAPGGIGNQIQYNGGLNTLGAEIYYTSTNQNVGIGSSLPSSKLDVSGNVQISGIITASTISSSTISSTNATLTNISGTIGTITTLNSTNANIANLNLTQLSYSGVSTFSVGPVFIGSGTSTGTVSQPLQVTGGTYVSGNLGVGFTNPTSKLYVSGDAYFTGIVTCTDLNSTSDVNLKSEVATIENGLEKINSLRGVNFKWKETEKPSMGVIAQELEEVLPELVTDSDPKTVNYNGIVGVLIEAVKELTIEINEIKKQLNN